MTSSGACFSRGRGTCGGGGATGTGNGRGLNTDVASLLSANQCEVLCNEGRGGANHLSPHLQAGGAESVRPNWANKRRGNIVWRVDVPRRILGQHQNMNKYEYKYTINTWSTQSTSNSSDALMNCLNVVDQSEADGKVWSSSYKSIKKKFKVFGSLFEAETVDLSTREEESHLQ